MYLKHMQTEGRLDGPAWRRWTEISQIVFINDHGVVVRRGDYVRSEMRDGREVFSGHRPLKEVVANSR